MNLLVAGFSFRQTPLALRERLAFDEASARRTLAELAARGEGEAALLSTCNRVELYLGRPSDAAAPDAGVVLDCLAASRGVPAAKVSSHLYQHRHADAVRHLFRVAAGLDSLVLGEGQVAGQVRRAYELARQAGTAGPLLHGLFQHANRTAGRVRSETGIARGRASIPSVAIEYMREVFAHFEDKTVLVIGTGKVGGLTLRHLRRLGPRRVLVANRSLEKAVALAQACAGEAVSWEKLDDALAEADIVLSTTGATEPIVTRQRYARVQARRRGQTTVILDLAVPRDFDPAIHDGEATCLFNIDDLTRVRDRTLRDRMRHVGAAEAIVAEEQSRFLADWSRRRNGPLIARLREVLEAKRRAVVGQLLTRLNGRLTEEEQATIEGAFRLLQNQFLHGPISALAEEPPEGSRHTLREALRKLFGLAD